MLYIQQHCDEFIQNLLLGKVSDYPQMVHLILAEHIPESDTQLEMNDSVSFSILKMAASHQSVGAECFAFPFFGVSDAVCVSSVEDGDTACHSPELEKAACTMFRCSEPSSPRGIRKDGKRRCRVQENTAETQEDSVTYLMENTCQ